MVKCRKTPPPTRMLDVLLLATNTEPLCGSSWNIWPVPQQTHSWNTSSATCLKEWPWRSQRSVELSYTGQNCFDTSCLCNAVTSWTFILLLASHILLNIDWIHVDYRNYWCEEIRPLNDLRTISCMPTCVSFNTGSYYYYWLLLYSAILRSWADSLRSHVIVQEWIAFYSAFLNIHRSGVLTALARLVPQESAAILARSVYTIQPCTMSLHAKPHT